MQTILYFQSPTRTSAPEKIAGVREIMDKKRIHVQVVEETPTKALLKGLAAFWHPLGAIVDCGNEYNELDAAIFAGMHTVFLGHNPTTLPRTSLQVMHDQAATARKAAQELLETRFEEFAFVNFRERRAWSESRGKEFSDVLALNGKQCHVFESKSPAQSEVAYLQNLREFLSSLPKPCAVFAANDKTGESVLSTAQIAGLKVPGEIAVISVDNYGQICERTTPPLTSIEPDFRKGGALAALMLLDVAMSKGKYRGNRVLMFGPMRIVRRASTRLLMRNDKHVSAALDLIRREACNGLQAAKVAAIFPCSRRMADIRFSRAVGHSILSEIHAIQLERTKHLLKNANMQLKAISDFCGFANPNSLRKFFLKATGLTMTDWRNAHTDGTLPSHHSDAQRRRGLTHADSV